MVINKSVNAFKPNINTKYTVITGIFGNYEIIRDPETIFHDTTYICITDNPNLKSNIWNIIVDTTFIKPHWSPRKKTYFVRYHPFNYTDSEYCYWVDGSLKIVNMNFDEISTADLIYFNGMEINTYIKDFLLKWDVSMDNKYAYTNMYTKFISATNTLNFLYDYSKNDMNKKYYHIHGSFRGHKNCDTIKVKLNEVYEFLISHYVSLVNGQSIDYNDDIMYYDEGIAGIILDKIPANKLDFNDVLKYKKSMIFYNHNNFIEREL